MANTTSAKKTKKPSKRHEVGVGDLVMYYTSESHMFGVLGEVTHVLDKDRVVAKCLASGHASFTEVGLHVVLLTSEPQGQTKDGDNKSYFAQYITRVVHRATPKPPKAPKKILPPKVIETTEQLIEHLETGSAKERIILDIDKQEKTA